MAGFQTSQIVRFPAFTYPPNEHRIVRATARLRQVTGTSQKAVTYVTALEFKTARN